MGGIKGGVGSFLLRKAASNKSIRQKHLTGPQYNKRKVFPRFQKQPVNNANTFSFSNFGPVKSKYGSKKHYHQLHRRDAPARQLASPTQQPEYDWYRHLPGDVQQLPEKDYSFGLYVDRDAPFELDREEGNHIHTHNSNKDGRFVYQKERTDRLVYSWRRRGRLHLHKMEKKETFVCYYCGYPTKSALVAVVDDNWDFRMCYRCYNNVMRQGLEEHPT